MSKRSAIITGITGMDGSLLADYLLTQDYNVYGLKRRSSSNSLGNSQHLAGQIEVIEGDLTDLSSLCRLVNLARPHEFYGLGAQSDVGISFKEPVHTTQCNAIGTLNSLEAIRLSGFHTRYYFAATSEMFGGIHGEKKVGEDTCNFHPRSPYGCSKLYGYWITRNYREAYRMFACSGILFNHEHYRRGSNFVTRKITMAVAKIKKGLQDKLYLGNLDSKRDWGWAPDFVKGQHMILNYAQPEDFVLATGETHTVREFCDLAFSHVGLDYKNYVEIDPRFYRPAEVDVLLGDYSKAKKLLGWRPETTFKDLVLKMTNYDLNLLPQV